MRLHGYFRARFERLLGAGVERVWFADEVWYVTHNGRRFAMPIGTDDDEFAFTWRDAAGAVTVRFAIPS